jgi:GcrA cell cycle regulator
MDKQEQRSSPGSKRGEAFDADLRRLWGVGDSISAIGRKLGVSRNVVVGRAHRLDLPGRESPIRRDNSHQA